MDSLANEYFGLVKRKQEGEITDRDALFAVVATRLAAAIERLAPAGSVYRAQAERYTTGPMIPGSRANGLITILLALQRDYGDGYLTEIEGSVRRRVFGDFLDMAQHLLDEYDRLPAGVIAGATLEEHLRKLCDPNGIATTKANGKPEQAESLNAALRDEGAYDLSMQKQVTAWLDLRNKAAHGRRDEFSDDQVRLMIDGVRQFTLWHPA